MTVETHSFMEAFLQESLTGYALCQDKSASSLTTSLGLLRHRHDAYHLALFVYENEKAVEAFKNALTTLQPTLHLAVRQVNAADIRRFISSVPEADTTLVYFINRNDEMALWPERMQDRS